MFLTFATSKKIFYVHDEDGVYVYGASDFGEGVEYWLDESFYAEEAHLYPAIVKRVAEGGSNVMTYLEFQEFTESKGWTYTIFLDD